MNTPEAVLAAYVPQLAIRLLEHGLASANQASGERLQGTVLVAHIAGFVRLADNLEAYARLGTNKFSADISRYFGQLIAEINKHGGDVIKFGNDTFVALWLPATAMQDPQVDLGPVSLQAVQCALALQALTQLHEQNRLALKIGIAAGPVTAVHIGGVAERWEFLLVGDPVVDASRLAAGASSATVLATLPTWELIRSQSRSRPFNDDAVEIESLAAPIRPQKSPERAVAPPLQTLLRAYIPSGILPHLVAGLAEWLAEIRRVSVVFLSLDDFDRTTTTLGEAQSLIYLLQTELYRHGGTISQLGVDHRGTIALAVFGLPPLGYEDNPARAVRAARAIESRMKELGLGSTLGVATGLAFCGIVGTPERREYTVIGNVVNIAECLMLTSQRRVLCDTATYQATRDSFVFESLAPLVLEDHRAPLEVYAPLTETRNFERGFKAIIGRHAERIALAAQVHQLVDSQRGSAVLIEGEAGIGKSRLLAEIRRQAADLGAVVLTGAGDQTEQGTLYYAWRSVFSQMFQLDDLSDPDRLRSRIIADLDKYDDLRPVIPLLNAVLPLDFPENTLTSQMAGTDRANSSRKLFLRLLLKFAEQDAHRPVVLLLEDAHWLDSSSWALILDLNRADPRILIVLASRFQTDGAVPEYKELLQTPNLRCFTLTTLSYEEIGTLVAERLDIESLPPPIHKLIWEKAGGHPFFSEELAYALRDSGVIHISGPQEVRYNAAHLPTLTYLDTLPGVLNSRINRLNPSQQLTLKVASIVGQMFSFKMLHGIYPSEITESELFDDLRILQSADLLVPVGADADLTWTFKHIIVKDVAYGLMIEGQQQQLHRAIAAWYEETASGNLDASWPILAYHWSKGQKPGKAMYYLDKAGEQALRNGAYQEAITFFESSLEFMAAASSAKPDFQFFETALELVPTAPVTTKTAFQEAHWRGRIGEAYLGLGQVANSQQYIERALHLMGYPLPTRRAELLARSAYSLLSHLGRQLLRSRFPATGVPPDKALTEVAQVHQQMLQVVYYNNDFLCSLYTVAQGLRLAEKAGPCWQLARAYALFAGALGFARLYRLMRHYERLAWKMAQQVNDLPTMAWVSMISGISNIGSGQLAAAQAVLTRSSEINDQLGNERRWLSAYDALIHAHLYQGNFAQAQVLSAELYTAAAKLNNAQAQGWALLDQIMCAWPQDAATWAEDHLNRTHQLLGENAGQQGERIWEMGLRALVYLRQGQHEAAQRAAQAVLALARKNIPVHYSSLDGLAAATETLVCLLELSATPPALSDSRLRALAEQACKAMRSHAQVFPLGRARALLWQGLYYWITGYQREGVRTWEHALGLAQRLHLPYEEGLIHYEWGRHLTGSARQHHLTQAVSLFTRLDATRDLERANAAL